MDKKDKKTRIAITVLTVLIIALITAAVALITKPFIDSIGRPEEFREWISRRGVSGVLIYIGMVVLQIVAAVIPGEPFEIAAGYSFGVIKGTVFCMLAEGIGSILVLFLSRRFGIRLVECIFSREKLESVRFLRSSKAKMILFTLIFILPGTPKDLLCYYAGLTNMSFPLLAAICFFGRFPSIVTSTVGGSALGDKNYLFAVAVFAVTAIVSIAGILIYNKINERKNDKS